LETKVWGRLFLTWAFRLLVSGCGFFPLLGLWNFGSSELSSELAKQFFIANTHILVAVCNIDHCLIEASPHFVIII
jgi:hypothetical protein